MLEEHEDDLADLDLHLSYSKHFHDFYHTAFANTEKRFAAVDKELAPGETESTTNTRPVRDICFDIEPLVRGVPSLFEVLEAEIASRVQDLFSAKWWVIPSFTRWMTVMKVLSTIISSRWTGVYLLQPGIKYFHHGDDRTEFSAKEQKAIARSAVITSVAGKPSSAAHAVALSATSFDTRSNAEDEMAVRRKRWEAHQSAFQEAAAELLLLPRDIENAGAGSCGGESGPVARESSADGLFSGLGSVFIRIQRGVPASDRFFNDVVDIIEGREGIFGKHDEETKTGCPNAKCGGTSDRPQCAAQPPPGEKTDSRQSSGMAQAAVFVQDVVESAKAAFIKLFGSERRMRRRLKGAFPDRPSPRSQVECSDTTASAPQIEGKCDSSTSCGRNGAACSPEKFLDYMRCHDSRASVVAFAFNLEVLSALSDAERLGLLHRHHRMMQVVRDHTVDVEVFHASPKEVAKQHRCGAAKNGRAGAAFSLRKY